MSVLKKLESFMRNVDQLRVAQYSNCLNEAQSYLKWGDLLLFDPVAFLTADKP